MNRAGRDEDGDDQSRRHFIFQVHVPTHNCRRKWSDTERSGIVPWPVRGPKGLNAHVSKSGEI
jgi:hypothetical protein